MRNFVDWCQSVLSLVRFKADHEEIQKELQDHYEDHVKDLERIGYDTALAKERVLNAMGDPEEVGKAMDRAHKPWLGWLWLLSRWGVIAAIYTAIFCVILLGWTEFPLSEFAQREGDYEPSGHFYFGEEDRETSHRVLTGTGSSTVERAGDVFSVPYAAVWEDRYGAYWITVVLAVDDSNPFDVREGDFLKKLKLTFDDGTYYDTDYDYELDDAGNAAWGPSAGMLRGGPNSSDPFRTLYYIRIDPRRDLGNGEWCELSYPYGDPWSIRVNWKEGSSA